MYLIRRVFKAKPGNARKVAEVVAKMGKAFEDAGQRSPTRVYLSGGTVPGPANTVYMDWVAERIESPSRPGNKVPDMGSLGAQLVELLEESHIEFYELFKGG